MKQKTIVYFVDGLNHGGVESVVLQLSNGLHADYDIHVIVLYEDQKDMLPLFHPNVQIHFLSFNQQRKGLSQYIHQLKPLKELLKQISPDVIHAHNSSFSYLFLSLAIQASHVKCKCFRTLHFSGFFLEKKTRGDKVRLFLDALGAKITRTVIVGVSPFVTEIAKKNYPSNSHLTICNGVDCMGKFNPDIKHELPTVMKKEQESDLNVVYVARLCEGKGHVTLMHAWKELAGKYSHLRLFLIGDGPLYNELNAWIQEADLADRITLVGAVSNVDDYLAHSDFAVFPSLSEGFGLVLLEKMAMQLPVVASSIPVFQFLIENTKTGLLFDLMESRDLVRKVEVLVNHPSLCKEMGQEARETVMSHYSIERMIENYINLYRN